MDQRKENDHRNYFTINLHKSMVSKAGIELAIHGSAIGLATNCTMGPGINTNSFGHLSENILHISDNKFALYILIVILQAQLGVDHVICEL